MTNSEIEKRLTTIEQQLSELLKDKKPARSQPVEFFERLKGAFVGHEDAVREAARLGRAWRQKQNRISKPKTKSKAKSK